MMRGAGPILLASVCFGVMAVAVRCVGPALSAMQIAGIRFVGSFLVLLIGSRGGGLGPRTASIGALVLRGLIGAAAIVCYFVGIRDAGAAVATLVQNTHPVFTALIAGTILRERVTVPVLVALVLDLAGVAIVIGPGARLGPDVVRGALFALGAAILAGGAVTTAGLLRRTERASVITLYFMAVGALVTAPSLVGGVPPLSTPVVAALAVMIVTSAVGQWLLHHGLGFTTPTTGSLAAAASVITAAICEAAWLGAVPAPHTLVGGALMLAAVWLASARA
ncbi:MAG: DMT family transporter [Candidatus Binatia bacterium]